MRAVTWLLTLTLTLGLVASCSIRREIPRADVQGASTPSKPFTRFTSPRGQRVAGFTTRDGTRHRFEGRSQLEGDTLVITRPRRSTFGLEKPDPRTETRIPVAEVESVWSEEISTSRSAAVAVFFGVPFGIAFWYGVVLFLDR